MNVNIMWWWRSSLILNLKTYESLILFFIIIKSVYRKKNYIYNIWYQSIYHQWLVSIRNMSKAGRIELIGYVISIQIYYILLLCIQSQYSKWTWIINLKYMLTICTKTKIKISERYKCIYVNHFNCSIVILTFKWYRLVMSVQICIQFMTVFYSTSYLFKLSLIESRIL